MRDSVFSTAFSGDQVGYHLGVRFGFEGHALFDELCLEACVVLDNAVVDDGNLAVKAYMGVGVLLCGGAVGGPAGVGDTDGSLYGIVFELRFQGADFTGSAYGGNFSMVDEGNSRAVVTAVFQFLQTAHEDGQGFTLTDIGDYSAHKNP